MLPVCVSFCATLSVCEGCAFVSVSDGPSVRHTRHSLCACENLIKYYRKLFSTKLDNPSKESVCFCVQERVYVCVKK